ncbi:YicC/YloC family endoribonuclease [Paenibacillus sp. sgz500958]|uniref:YicC/YloC family endoribonuclease n=1 Tax=Paenibacillus sp. sgz500958 TaxID=3242475 RepID=UPI0036D42A41
MSFSMTGYGQSSLNFDGYKVMFEVKSVNHRYSEVVLRVPREWASYEDLLRRRVQHYIKRGRVDVTVSKEPVEETASGRTLNIPVVKAYLNAADVLKREFGVAGELSLSEILCLPGVMEEDTDSVPEPVNIQLLPDALQQGLEQSLMSLLEMRAREGRFLSDDLVQRLDKLQELHHKMTELSGNVVNDYRDKLRQRLNELSDGIFPFDEHKFGMEIALFADRCNIDEELIRLDSHIGQCRELLNGEDSVGRKLDFLIQEMNRETNTIGSKCNHLTLVNHALEIKAELEKIREQAANLE